MKYNNFKNQVAWYTVVGWHKRDIAIQRIIQGGGRILSKKRKWESMTITKKRALVIKVFV